jgi:hypothetical protein
MLCDLQEADVELAPAQRRKGDGCGKQRPKFGENSPKSVRKE